MSDDPLLMYGSYICLYGGYQLYNQYILGYQILRQYPLGGIKQCDHVLFALGRASATKTSGRRYHLQQQSKE